MLSLVTTLVLLVVGMVVLYRSKSRRALVMLGMIALLPLLFGVLGTAAGYSQVASAEALMESPNEAVFQRSREQARYTTYLGFGCTALLWVIGVVGASRVKRNTE
jgi:hypothetical protein